jgi:hypothetical protein
MPADYVQVLADLDEQIAHHKKELEELQAARPAIVALRNKFNPIVQLPFTGMGATAAIRELISKSGAWWHTAEIVAQLTDKGWKTESNDPNRIVATTLSQMKSAGYVEKRHDMWKWLPVRVVPLNVQATDSTVFDSPGAPNSLAETTLRQRLTTSVS